MQEKHQYNPTWQQVYPIYTYTGIFKREFTQWVATGELQVFIYTSAFIVLPTAKAQPTPTSPTGAALPGNEVYLPHWETLTS